jgi:mRNA-degrading endonuclease RelE of RelBE toxin-antitoxin system
LVLTTTKQRSIKIRSEEYERLQAFKVALGEATMSKAFARGLNAMGVSQSSIEGKSPVATSENVDREGAPVVIFGRPNSGKSYTLRNLARAYNQQGTGTIVIDLANEHQDLGKKISANAALTRRFKRGNFRIVPETDPRLRLLSITRIFERLLMLAEKGRLRDFAVLIDEGNELTEIKELKDFLIESRKFIKKAVIVSADPTSYEKICVPMKPIPFEKENAVHELTTHGQAALLPPGQQEVQQQ